MTTFREKVCELYNGKCHMSNGTLNVSVKYGNKTQTVREWIYGVIDDLFDTKKERSAWWKQNRWNWDIIFEKLTEKSSHRPLVEHLDLFVRASAAMEHLSKNTRLPHPLRMMREPNWRSQKKRMDEVLNQGMPDCRWSWMDPFMWFFGSFSMMMCDIDQGQFFDIGTFDTLYNAFDKTEQQCLNGMKKQFKIQIIAKDGNSMGIPKCGLTLLMKTFQNERHLCVYDRTPDKNHVMTIFDHGGACFFPSKDGHSNKILDFIHQLNDENDDGFLDTLMKNVCCCIWCGKDITKESSLLQGAGDICMKRYASTWKKAVYNPDANLVQNTMDIDIGTELIRGIIPANFRQHSAVIQSMMDGGNDDEYDGVFDVIRTKYDGQTLSIISQWIDMLDASEQKKLWFVYMYMFDQQVFECMDFLDMRDRHGRPLVNYLNQMVEFVHHGSVLEQYTIKHGYTQYQPKKQEFILNLCRKDWRVNVLETVYGLYPDLVNQHKVSCLRAAVHNSCSQNVAFLLSKCSFVDVDEPTIIKLMAIHCKSRDIFDQLTQQISQTPQIMSEVMEVAVQHANPRMVSIVKDTYPTLEVYKDSLCIMAKMDWGKNLEYRSGLYSLGWNDINTNRVPSIDKYIRTISSLYDVANLSEEEGGKNVLHLAAEQKNINLLLALKHGIEVGWLPGSLVKQEDSQGNLPAHVIAKHLIRWNDYKDMTRPEKWCLRWDFLKWCKQHCDFNLSNQEGDSVLHLLEERRMNTPNTDTLSSIPLWLPL